MGPGASGESLYLSGTGLPKGKENVIDGAWIVAAAAISGPVRHPHALQ